MADLVTLAEAKSYLTVVHSDDDTVIGELIDYMTAMVETYTNRSFTQSTITDELVDGGTENLAVEFPPIDSVTTIKDGYDSDATIASANYVVDSDAGLIYPSQSITTLLSFINNKDRLLWADGRGRWKITYVAGYDGAPDDVKGATLGWIADMYTSPDSLKSERLGDRSVTRDDKIPSRVKLVLDKYVLHQF